MTRPTCKGTTATGPCKAQPRRGLEWCPWHNPDPAARERHRAISAHGGRQKAYGALASTAPLMDDPRTAALDLSTAVGLRDYMAATLAQLGRLPFSERTANSIANVVNAQRSVLETSDHEERLAALEQRDTAA